MTEALLLLSALLSFCAAGFTGFVNGRLIGRFVIGFDMACSFEQTARQASGRRGRFTKPPENQPFTGRAARFVAILSMEFGKICPANAAGCRLLRGENALLQSSENTAEPISAATQKCPGALAHHLAVAT
ncbi:hypothetical protein [Bosea sp. Root670]|uniref:hypothetical protein n=1 Tax=Bosea sp. Root670 TaxID=1736583 RepID=UPI0012E3F566|nr:hypothetical protein [Bosea sp. Root670]